MYPRTQAKDENSLVTSEKKDNERMDFGDGHNFLGQNLSSSLNPKDKSSLNEVSCQCSERMKDEEQKEAVVAEIYLTYEEILQLEQALIELDE
jgi:hypothetical protein